MGSASKTFALMLILMSAISCVGLLTIKHVYAQSTPTASVPQFTVHLVGPTIIVNTTYYLDPNTGQIKPNIGYTNPYSYIVASIKNQPFTAFTDSQGNTIQLYYNVRVKNTNQTDNWIVLLSGAGSFTLPTTQQSTNSEYTNISIPIQYESNDGVYSIEIGRSLAGTQLDIQVEAMLGYIYFGSVDVFYNITTTNWSNSQTISVPANVPLSPTPAPSSTTSPLTPTETPTSTAASGSLISFLLITNTVSLIIIAFLLAVIIALLLYMRKRNRLVGVKP
jgi:hypothetical protein